MAELNQDSGKGGKGGKVRAKKNGGKVDLTAMVDLAFLLITFFMLTTSLNKPQAMDVAMPDKDKTELKEPVLTADNRSVTVLLGSDNKVSWYYGQINAPIEGPTVTGFGADGIRKALIEKKAYVPRVAGGKDVIVIIRPSAMSTQKDLVDILDEMKIVDIKRYMIAQISPEEIDVLKRDNIYND
ncbi:ExbD/TolR family protein [Sphingobacterium faecium]|uniref:ExbD/TolR family protein n=1 Tax=Sphingobacterium faecium TaxID=34087 RepID=UPI002468DF95|nr:biopolymer transporter ExbD [Sphingobacterium faecium]MDH5828585.1 biopolymer transporter ExbD [Sphingobacterium faecium]